MFFTVREHFFETRMFFMKNLSRSSPPQPLHLGQITVKGAGQGRDGVAGLGTVDKEHPSSQDKSAGRGVRTPSQLS